MKKSPILLSIISIFSLVFLNGCNVHKDSNNPSPVKPDGDPVEPKGTVSFDIYATNDIHGQVESDGNSMSITTLGSFMKKKGQEENTLLIDQGDSWQGSIYSNFNHGSLVNDVMSAVKYDARTIGNHDFDWGIDVLKHNTASGYNDYTIPVLGANIYNYDFVNKVEGNVFQSDIGQKTVTYTLENGLKVGIVGIIGCDQITAITSSYIQDICFKDHIPIIKEEATKLRNEGCDVVILSAHSGQDSLMYNNLGDYVDLALCGHTHRYEKASEGDLYYVQFGAYNERIGHIRLKYDLDKKKVVQTSIEALSRSQVENETIAPDSEISQIVNNYMNECSSEANVVLANNVSSSFARNGEAANMMCRALMDACLEEGHDDVILTYCNQGRKNLPYGMWKYADLYNTYPFDNVVYIADIKGSDILRQVKGNNFLCYNSSFNYQIDSNQTYRIACIDYLLFHTNEIRYYDYFRSFNGTVVGQLSKNYRLILREWLLKNGYDQGKSIDPSDFSSYNDSYNRSLLTEIY